MVPPDSDQPPEQPSQPPATRPSSAPTDSPASAEIIREIERLPPEERAQLISLFIGPLPPPDMLAHYKRVQPDFPERLMQAVEAERRHRHGLDVQDRTDLRIDRRRAQIFAFIIVLASLAVTAYAFYTGANLTALGIILTEVIGIAGVYLGKEYMKKKTEGN